jgi:hypothetical protein
MPGLKIYVLYLQHSIEKIEQGRFSNAFTDKGKFLQVQKIYLEKHSHTNC